MLILWRQVPARAEDRDEAQDRLYAEDFEEKIQRMVDTRLEERRPVSGAGGLWSHLGLLRMSGAIHSQAVKRPNFLILAIEAMKDMEATERVLKFRI